MAEIDEQWLMNEVNHIGLQWREADRDREVLMAEHRAGMLQALGDVMVRAGIVDEDEAGRLIDFAKGTDQD